MNKNKKRALYAFVAALCVLFTSCQDHVGQDSPQVTEEEMENLSETEISREEALENLKGVLQSWCQSELRSGDEAYSTHSRMLAQLTDYDVRKVRTVTTNDHSMRSASKADNKQSSSYTSEQQDPRLMHLVNFDEGGYAVVSADRRIPSFVLAVVDEGCITEQDFHTADSLYTEEDIRKEIPDFKLYNDTIGDFYSMSATRQMVNQELYAYAHSYAASGCYIDESNPYDPYDPDRGHRRNSQYNRDPIPCGHIPDGGGYGPKDLDTDSDTHTSTSWVIEKEVPMMIQTIWHQESPFNNLMPSRRKFWVVGPKKKAPAGCGPIALAQILTYMNDVSYSFNGRPINYDLLQGFCTLSNTNTSDPIARDEAAYLLCALGLRLHTVYGYDFGLTLPINVKRFLRDYGYKDVKRTFDANDRKTEILKSMDRGCPVFITSGSRLFSFHSWVIDGYRKEVRVSKTTKTDTGEVLSETRDQETLYVHCNYGWFGGCNGFYTYDVFDTRAGAKEFANEKEKYVSKSLQGKSDYHILTNVITFDRR